MKKIISLFLCAVLCIALFSSCSVADEKEDGRLSIIATIFPQYDFTREIGQDKVNLQLLIPPGGESHTYEPTPQDIIGIENADIFIYVGGENDKWIDTVLNEIDNPKLAIIKLLDCVDILDEEIVDGMQSKESHGDDGETEPDEHVWTSPINAIKISQCIAEKMIEKDPGNADFYTENLTSYIEKLQALDDKFMAVVKEGKTKTVVFGDRFPLRYFAQRYSLTYYAAFPGCSSESEPGAKTIAFLIEKVKADKIPVIFYIEFSNHKAADTIAQESGAKTMLFHSCHNVSLDEMKNGVTYLSLMGQNLSALQQAIG